MGIIVKCAAGHGPSSKENETIREIARQFDKKYNTVGRCLARKGSCEAERTLHVEHKSPDKVKHTYDVVAVEQMYSASRAEQLGRDPMVFLLRDQVSGEYGLWTYYWIKNRNGKWANGQFPPLLMGEDAERLRTSINDLRRLMRDKSGR